MSTILQAALALASKGIAVFPCHPGTKVPATPRGFHDASADLAQVRAWWAENPEYNLAFQPQLAGWAVVDLDGDEGEASWLNLEIEHGVPDTRIARTPRGGRHLYFQGELPPSQSKLGVHIDTRGGGSYVLLPPSVVDGKPYTWEDARDPAPLPAWVGEHLAAAAKDKVSASVDDLDLPANVERARRHLERKIERGDIAIEGQMGDLKTFVTACEVMNLGVSEDTAFGLLRGAWNAACQPPWDEDELQVKVHNAAEYAQNAMGAWGTRSASENFGAALDKLGLMSQGSTGGPGRFHAFRASELRDRPPVEWLAPEFLPELGLGLIYGPSGSYKTFLAIHKSAELAHAGRPVVWLAGEGAPDVFPRLNAWCQLREVDLDKLPFFVVENMPWCSDGAMVREFIESVLGQEIKPDLVVLDTLATFGVGLNENDAKDAGLMIAGMKAIRDALSSAVLAIHHTGKDTDRGARGSGAITAGVDSGFEVVSNTETKATALHVRRQRSAKRREEPWYFEGKDLAGSLVFQEVGRAAYRALTQSEDQHTTKAVHAALVKLKAFGESRAVTTYVLASEVQPPQPDETHEGRAEAVERTVRSLRALARTKLDVYTHGTGRDLMWCLPAIPED